MRERKLNAKKKKVFLLSFGNACMNKLLRLPILLQVKTYGSIYKEINVSVNTIYWWW